MSKVGFQDWLPRLGFKVGLDWVVGGNQAATRRTQPGSPMSQAAGQLGNRVNWAAAAASRRGECQICDVPGPTNTINPKIIKNIKKQSKKQSNTHSKNGAKNIQKQSKKQSKKLSKISQNYQKTIKNQPKLSKNNQKSIKTIKNRPKNSKMGAALGGRGAAAGRKPPFLSFWVNF